MCGSASAYFPVNLQKFVPVASEEEKEKVTAKLKFLKERPCKLAPAASEGSGGC